MNPFPDFPHTQKMPSLFVGHGNPMHAIENSPYALAWAGLGTTLPRPRAILSISAHWLTNGTKVLDAVQPRTIHDFAGFPEDLFQVQYPCPGSPALADWICQEVRSVRVEKDSSWGIDHGTWSVLRRMFPEADIPVAQLSIDIARDAAFHFELGRRLAPLRRRGVLIVGSGNIVHNLRLLKWQEGARPHEWASEFDAKVVEHLIRHDDASLVEYQRMGEAAKLSVPTPDHYFPFLYVLGTREASDRLAFPVEGIDLGSVSMRAVQFS